MRGEDAGERRGCDATMSFKYHGKQGPAVIRMPAQVPRGNIYQDGEIGGAQDPAHSPLGERTEGR